MNGDRRSPITLAGDAPVLQPVGDGRLAEAVLLGVFGHDVLRFLAGEAVPRAGVDQQAVFERERQHRRLGLARSRRLALAARQNYDANLKPVFLGELVVALVVRRHAHDGAGAVVQQDVVGHPDGHALAVERIDGVEAGEDAFLLQRADVARFPGLALVGEQLVDSGLQLGIERDQVGDQRVLGRELHRGGSHDGVDARGEDRDLVARGTGGVIQFEVDQRALGAADPVALHDAHFFRPALQSVEAGEQFFGISGGAQEPLLQIALLDRPWSHGASSNRPQPARWRAPSGIQDTS